MCLAERARQFDGDMKHIVNRKALVTLAERCQMTRQWRPFDQFDHDIVEVLFRNCIEIEDLDNMRVMKLCNEPGFTLKARGKGAIFRKRIMHHLDGDKPIKLYMTSAVHGRHAALTQHFENLVTSAEGSANQISHCTLSTMRAIAASQLFVDD